MVLKKTISIKYPYQLPLTIKGYQIVQKKIVEV